MRLPTWRISSRGRFGKIVPNATRQSWSCAPICYVWSSSWAGGDAAHRLPMRLTARPNTFLDSIAVLPFDNPTNDSDTEYLSDGIAETILNSLSQLTQLRVVPRTTAFRYRRTAADPVSIGRELGVRLVLT